MTRVPLLRQQSFSRTAVKLGMASPHIESVPARASHASGRLAISNTIDRRPDLDAVFCSSDMLAMGVMTELRARTIAVPESIAVIGFGDLDFSATLAPALTTVRIDGAQLGRTAARFIVESAQNKSVDQRVVDIGFTIVERKSA